MPTSYESYENIKLLTSNSINYILPVKQFETRFYTFDFQMKFTFPGKPFYFMTPILAGIINAEVPDSDFIPTSCRVDRNFPCNIGDDDRSAVENL